MLYMHMDHSALTFHTTTVLCIKLPRQANKEGIYEAVKAARQVTSWESAKRSKVCRCRIKIGGEKIWVK